MVSQNPQYCKSFEKKLSLEKTIYDNGVRALRCYASPKPEFFFNFSVYIFIHISANMSPFGLKFSQMILHTEASKLHVLYMYVQLILSLCSFAQANTLTQYL